MRRAVRSSAPALPETHVARPVLVRSIRGHAVVVISAGGGWGKSTLASEVASNHRGDVTWVTLSPDAPDHFAGLTQILEPLGLGGMLPEPGDSSDWQADFPDRVRAALARRRRPHLVVIDEVSHDLWPAVELLVQAIGGPGMPDGTTPMHRLLVLGRDLRGHGEFELGNADLALSAEEFGLMLAERVPGGVSRTLVRLLVEESSGWCTVLRSIAGALARSPSPEELGRSLLHDNAPLDNVLAGMLAQVGEETRAELSVAAGLPVLDRRIARRLALEHAVAAGQRVGIPWETPDVGPWTLPDPVADLIAAGARDSNQITDLVAEVYGRAGMHLEAARYAIGHNRQELAAALLAAAPSHELSQEFKPAVLAILGSFDDELMRANPGLHVQTARLLTASARYADRNTYVERHAPGLESIDHDAATALRAERFRDLAYFSPTPDPADIQAIVRALSNTGDLATRSRLEQGLALLLARRDGVAAAEQGLRRSALAAERAGDLNQAALALRDLAWVVLLELGRLRQVVETFDRIEAMLGPDTRTTAWRVNRAETLLWLGDLDGAERDLDVATQLALLHHDDQHVAYAAWARASLESMRGRRLATLAAVQQAEAMAGDWLHTVTGVMFYAQAADALSRVGLAAEARQRLATAVSRRGEDPRPVAVAEFALEARIGDPAHALDLVRSIDLDDLEPFEAPRIMLLAALAELRNGSDATEAAGRAFAAYAAQGLLDSARAAERAACEALVPLARSTGAPVPNLGVAAADQVQPISATELAELLASRHGLRPREAEVVIALRGGGSNAQIASQLGISTATVRKHLQHAYASLEVRSRTEALAFLNTVG